MMWLPSDTVRMQSDGCRTSLPPTKEDVNVFARVCLSVCLSFSLLARLLKNACMDLDEMLCRQMSGHGRTD